MEEIRAALLTQQQQHQQQQQQLQAQQQQHVEDMGRMRAMIETMMAGLARGPQGGADGLHSAPSVTTRQIASVVDPKLLGAFPRFSGRDEDYLEWEVKVLSMCSLLGGLDTLMRDAARETTPNTLEMVNLDHDAQDKTKALYAMLVQAVQGRALTLLMSTEDQNGFLAWRALVREYKPSIASRHNALLVAAMTPKFTQDRSFSEQLTEWKRLLEEYRRATNKDLADDVKIAILTTSAPANVRAHVAQAAARSGTSYAALEKEIIDTEVGSRSFTALGVMASTQQRTEAVPMDIGVVSSAVCQFCGKRGHEAKSCWQIKGKSKGKGKDKDKSKQQPKGKDGGKGSSTAPFKGKCNHCGKVGHMAKDCRQKQQGQRSVSAVESSAAEQSGAQPESHQERVICVLEKETSILLCVDSGAEEHCGPVNELRKHGRQLPDVAPILKGVGGQRLQTFGVFALEYAVDLQNGESMMLVSNIVACDINKFILSVDKMMLNNLQCLFKSDAGPVMRAPKGDASLVRCGNSWHLLATLGRAQGGPKQICGASSSDSPLEVAIEGAPMPELPPELPPALPAMMPESTSVGVLRERLRALGGPVYGTKLELRSRLHMLETEVDRKRKERAWLAARASELAKKGGQNEERKVIPTPVGLPSIEEIRQHADAQHLPPASWCEVCIKARATSAPHVTVHMQRQRPRFEMDYNFYTSDLDMIPSKDGEPEKEAFATTLTCVDKMTGNVLHVAVPQKGVTSYSVVACASFIARCAYLEAELLTDGEPAIKALGEQVRVRCLKQLSIRLQLIVAPRYSSQTLGSVGAMQNVCAKQLRCLRGDFELRYGMELTPDHTLWAWLVRHSGWCIERLHIRGTGTTAYQDTFGQSYKGALVQFGEACLFRYAFPKSGKVKHLKIGKADLRFRKGLFVGKSYESDEFLFLTEAGCFASRTLKRLPKEAQTDVTLAGCVLGLPWAPEGQEKPPPRPAAQKPVVLGPQPDQVVEAGPHQGAEATDEGTKVDEGAVLFERLRAMDSGVVEEHYRIDGQWDMFGLTDDIRIKGASTTQSESANQEQMGGARSESMSPKRTGQMAELATQWEDSGKRQALQARADEHSISGGADSAMSVE
eukprot:6487010-Amphidinium_carterae.1